MVGTTLILPVATRDGVAVASVVVARGPITVTFAGARGVGAVALSFLAGPPGEGRPSGLPTLPWHARLATSGVAYLSARVCLPLDTTEATTSGLDPTDLRLWQVVDGRWRDVTDPVGRAPGVVCGTTATLSTVVVGGPLTGGASVASTATVHVPVAFRSALGR
ncbi:MAG: hypothetical protein NZ518_07085 [Dehalococcoidia bacterium]|nr:hypothetical protein [Dehalococcoidia bacterium]